MNGRSPGSPVTLRQVADAAGVSIATASRALNGGVRTVPEASGLLIRRVAQEMGYLPHANAQAVARGCSDLLGFAAPALGDPRTATHLSALCRVASGQRMAVLVSEVPAGGSPPSAARAAFARHGVRAVFVSGYAPGTGPEPGAEPPAGGSPVIDVERLHPAPFGASEGLEERLRHAVAQLGAAPAGRAGRMDGRSRAVDGEGERSWGLTPGGTGPR